ncbi:Uu.00g050600.m01.CDS01 [Anthostomella pinea]|uniref:Uu.00g050600.m01.CDS01 n=1 Tax=Anthostomella pinea TaxID=933095 RepID=A0AAI8VSN9_9PEZI|nr:Uu.00g050600.m01.CDS01 [Anthostomella pinea]
MPADFEKQSYWRSRFASETSFEWLTSSATFMSILEPYLSSSPRPARILQLGSGTSDLHTRFRARGYLDVTNVDYEPLALERGRALEARVFGDVRLEYAVADATRLDRDLLPKSQPQSQSRHGFDVVVDKSTADAVSCGGAEAVLRMAEGVRRCLADGGVWISLSYSGERYEVDGLPFDVEIVAKIPTPKVKAGNPEVWHWCYVLRPLEDEMCRRDSDDRSD